MSPPLPMFPFRAGWPFLVRVFPVLAGAASDVDPRGIRIKTPGRGWGFSAVAPVKGEEWNLCPRPDPLINGNRAGAVGNFPLSCDGPQILRHLRQEPIACPNASSSLG